MLAHDSLYTCSQLLLVKQITMNYTDPHIHEEMIGESAENPYAVEPTVFSLSENAIRKNKLVSCLSEICRVFYIVLFIYGQILYYEEGSNCAQVAPAMDTLLFVYICLGYLYIGTPIIVLILACLCMPVLILIGIMFQRRTQVPANNEAINKLPMIPFSPDLPGTHECSICMGDYAQGDSIIQLKCSAMHHFHADCLKKWLHINGLCPICRARIDVENGTGSNVEMQ